MVFSTHVGFTSSTRLPLKRSLDRHFSKKKKRFSQEDMCQRRRGGERIALNVGVRHLNDTPAPQAHVHAHPHNRNLHISTHMMSFLAAFTGHLKTGHVIDSHCVAMLARGEFERNNPRSDSRF